MPWWVSSARKTVSAPDSASLTQMMDGLRRRSSRSLLWGWVAPVTVYFRERMCMMVSDTVLIPTADSV
jgi:hypothetical protein